MIRLCDLMARVRVIDTNLSSLAVACGRLRTDSLKCEVGDTFLCLGGGRFDGHDFISTAVEHGAALIICERVTDHLRAHPEIKWVQVENTRIACAHMWNELCGRPSERMLFVAVTGTNGKTSTTWFLREIFKKAGYVTGVIGTVRCMIGDREAVLTDSPESQVNAMTTPAPEGLYTMLAEMANAGVEIVFMEVSSHSLMQHRTDPIHFTAGIFTGLSAEHLDYHGTMEAYFRAKRRLFDQCGAAVINGDDAYADRLEAELDIPSVRYSIAGKTADYSARLLVCDKVGKISYELCEKNLQQSITCPVTGHFMAANTLAAAATARLFCISQETIAAALETCPQIAGRMEKLPLPEGCDFEVFIDYAHTPDALENVLRTLLAVKAQRERLVVLFGCGGDRDSSKRPIMGRIATTLAELTILTADNSRTENPRAILCDILRGTIRGADVKVIEQREKAIRWAIETHRAGDVILLAGKGHEDYEIDAAGKHPFSERTIATEEAKRTLNK